MISHAITNLKYEQAQHYILVNQQTKEELFLSTFTIWVFKTFIFLISKCVWLHFAKFQLLICFFVCHNDHIKVFYSTFKNSYVLPKKGKNTHE